MSFFCQNFQWKSKKLTPPGFSATNQHTGPLGELCQAVCTCLKIKPQPCQVFPPKTIQVTLFSQYRPQLMPNYKRFSIFFSVTWLQDPDNRPRKFAPFPRLGYSRIEITSLACRLLVWLPYGNDASGMELDSSTMGISCMWRQYAILRLCGREFSKMVLNIPWTQFNRYCLPLRLSRWVQPQKFPVLLRSLQRWPRQMFSLPLWSSVFLQFLSLKPLFLWGRLMFWCPVRRKKTFLAITHSLGLFLLFVFFICYFFVPVVCFVVLF